MPRSTPESHAHPDQHKNALWILNDMFDELTEMKRNVHRGDPETIKLLESGKISLVPKRIIEKEVVVEKVVEKIVEVEKPKAKETRKTKKDESES